MKLFLLLTLITFTLVGTSCSHFQKPTASKDKKDKTKDNHPKLTKPKLKKVWVKEQVKGNRYIEAHWEYIIEENSKWTN